MPYIITTRVDVHGDGLSVDVTDRTAVTTLDEARDYTFNARVNDDGQIEPLSESGGTVGPLPDGTVIEIVPVTWTWLASQTTTPNVRGQAAIIAAFNAA